ncbi:MAG TPA: hypothetical protein VFI73_07925 [Candidatus Nitrosopolaris sp.]|nr:hypothetical protein [Candidatus Nitrosopolaris sp.]
MNPEVRNAYSYLQTKTDRYSISSLFIALFSDGTALVEQDVVLNPTNSNTVVGLYGSSIDGLNVMDYKGMSIGYQTGQQPGELIINSSGISNARLSYETPDLVNKQGRVWTFSFNSTTGFSLKLPTNSTIIDLGKQFPASVTQIGEQGLLTFQPGHIQLSYVIGYLGTEAQSSASIESAIIAIKDAGNRYPGIITADAQNLLRQALMAKATKKYSDAEKFSAEANNLTLNITRDYVASQNAITTGQMEVQKAAISGHDSRAASALLSQAKNEFSKGHYSRVKTLVDELTISIGTNASNPFPLFGIIGAIAVASVIAVLVFRKKKIRKRLRLEIEQDSDRGPLSKTPSHIAAPPQPSSFPTGSPPVEEQIRPVPSAEQTELSRAVTQILTARPYLRPEDQIVLKYLAEKDGAAFESEVRNKFLLPKTTIWRLVKRLEREELIEIRKAGGQNLIKLRIDGLER